MRPYWFARRAATATPDAPGCRNDSAFDQATTGQHGVPFWHVRQHRAHVSGKSTEENHREMNAEKYNQQVVTTK
jgi:hypothetical protein